jgi:molybdopterin synthase catalytic subunit
MPTVTDSPIDPVAARLALLDPVAGGYAGYEGWVRDFNAGRPVTALYYEAYAPMAEREMARIIAEAQERFEIRHAECIHRVGDLVVGDIAIWIGVTAVHRGPAFDACRYIIDEVKLRAPIWKKETYADGTAEWVNCPACAAAAHGHDAHSHTHTH